jgi:hypothetical protein
MPRRPASTASTLFRSFSLPSLSVLRNILRSTALLMSDRKSPAFALHWSTLSTHWRLACSDSVGGAGSPAGTVNPGFLEAALEGSLRLDRYLYVYGHRILESTGVPKGMLRQAGEAPVDIAEIGVARAC